MLLKHLKPAEKHVLNGLKLMPRNTAAGARLAIRDCFDNALPDIENAVTYIEDKIAEIDE